VVIIPFYFTYYERCNAWPITPCDSGAYAPANAVLPDGTPAVGLVVACADPMVSPALQTFELVGLQNCYQQGQLMTATPGNYTVQYSLWVNASLVASVARTVVVAPNCAAQGGCVGCAQSSRANIIIAVHLQLSRT
jgi:hypothetical protein